MKPHPFPTLCVLAASLLTGCASHPPSTEVSQAVIESLHRSVISEPPWRLEMAWQPGGLGGAAFRASSIEHVVRQNDHRPAILSPIPTAHEDADEVSPSPLNTYTAEEIDIAWRKYCHHRLEMSERDRDIVRDTPLPGGRLVKGCHPQSLYK